MATSISITFSDQQQMLKFVKIFNDYTSADKVNGEFMQQAIKGELGVLPDDVRPVSLFVSGTKILDGFLKDVQKKFDQEVAAHSASVDIRELVNGQWRKLRSRRTQQT